MTHPSNLDSVKLLKVETTDDPAPIDRVSFATLATRVDQSAGCCSLGLPFCSSLGSGGHSDLTGHCRATDPSFLLLHLCFPNLGFLCLLLEFAHESLSFLPLALGLCASGCSDRCLGSIPCSSASLLGKPLIVFRRFFLGCPLCFFKLGWLVFLGLITDLGGSESALGWHSLVLRASLLG